MPSASKRYPDRGFCFQRKHCDAFFRAGAKVGSVEHQILMRSVRPVALLLQEVFQIADHHAADPKMISFNWP